MRTHFQHVGCSRNWTRIVLAAASLLGVVFTGVSVSADPPSCPQGLHKRSAKQTIEEHLALMKAGNLDAAMCDYAEDAVVLLPGQTFVGRDAIQGGLSNFAALLGGVAPQITSLTATNDVVLITFTALGSPCTIPDGSDTYIVKKGRIAAQTVHDTLFSAPGMVCPLAVAGK